MQSDSTSRFDRAAATWDENPHRLAMGRAIAEAIRNAVPTDPAMAAIEIGCGTGLVTIALCDDLASILAVDTSTEMLNVLRGKVQELQVANVETLQRDLCAAEPLDMQADLVYSNMTLHHVRDPAQMVARAAGLLRRGGTLCIVDLDAEDGSFHPDKTDVEHFGFSADTMQGLLASAGLGELSSTVAHTVHRPDAEGVLRAYPVLATVGRKG